MKFNQYTWNLYKQTVIGIEIDKIRFPMQEGMPYSKIMSAC